MQTLTQTQIKYLLVVKELVTNRGYCRVTDMAKTLGITKGSVSTGNMALMQKGLIAFNEDSKMIHLTDHANEIVNKINERISIMKIYNERTSKEVFREADMPTFALLGTDDFFDILAMGDI